MSEKLQPTTVRISQEQIDALDEVVDEGCAPNRSEAIREAVSYWLQSDECEVPTEALQLAKFQRSKRLSRIHFYREGFRPMVRRVLRSVARTSPPWDPEVVRETAPEIFGPQIEDLFGEDRHEWAHGVLEDEIDRYAEAFEDDDDGQNPYVSAFEDDDEPPEGVDDPEPIHELDLEEVGLRPVKSARRHNYLADRDPDEWPARVAEDIGATRETAVKACEWVAVRDLDIDPSEARRLVEGSA